MRTGNRRLKVPHVVALTVEYLSNHGLLHTSLDTHCSYKGSPLPGPVSRAWLVEAHPCRMLCVSLLRHRRNGAQINEMLESGAPPDFSQVQPSDVASVLKYFLRELPEPLLTFDMYHNFIDVPGPSCTLNCMTAHVCM